MKTSQLPPVRVEPAVRLEIEAVLREGESLSQFVETATLQAARRRKTQDEFLARGRASLAKAMLSGELHAADETLNNMGRRLEQRIKQHAQALRSEGSAGDAKADAAAKL